MSSCHFETDCPRNAISSSVASVKPLSFMQMSRQKNWLSSWLRSMVSAMAAQSTSSGSLDASSRARIVVKRLNRFWKSFSISSILLLASEWNADASQKSPASALISDRESPRYFRVRMRYRSCTFFSVYRRWFLGPFADGDMSPC